MSHCHCAPCHQSSQYCCHNWECQIPFSRTLSRSEIMISITLNITNGHRGASRCLWPVCGRCSALSPCRKYKQPSDTRLSGQARGCGFLSRLWAATATIRLTFHLPLSFKPIVNVLKIALAKICPSPSFECYLVE